MRKKGHYEKVIPWKGESNELFACFVKGFHVIKFKVLNLPPILLTMFLQGPVLPVDALLYSLPSLMSAGGIMSKKKRSTLQFIH